jgi:Cu-Zn family superoxide dismutase
MFQRPRSVTVTVLPATILPITLVCLWAFTATRANGQESQDEAVEAKHEETAEKIDHLVAVLRPTEGQEVIGVVRFKQQGKAVLVSGLIHGLSPGKHGFHIHQYGDLTGWRDGKSAGGHFDPTGKPHGSPEAKERHIGDLGNIEANEEGVAKFEMRDDMIQLTGPHSILGRSVVVHEQADRFTQPSGDAGGRVAFGVIGVASPESASPESEEAVSAGGKAE